MSLTSSLCKVKEDILIVFRAREILIPEDRSNESSRPVEIHQQEGGAFFFSLVNIFVFGGSVSARQITYEYSM